MDVNTTGGRKALIDKIESNANLGRKAASYRASEIINDRIKPYVVEELRSQFNEDSVKEIPVISSVNIAKRVINQLLIYRDAPEREFTEVSDDQKEVVDLVYQDMMTNKKMNLANKVYKNHDQCLIQIIPKNGKLIMRVLKPHQWDAVPSQDDPEVAEAYIISAYDNYSELLEESKQPDSPTSFQTMHSQNNENYKNKKAMKHQEKESDKIYLIWTMDESFFCDSKGNIVGESTPNPLAQFGMMPFVEVSVEKEFEYWVRAQNTYASFTVEYCAQMSSVAQVVKLQNFAQAVIKAPQEMIPENIQIGPNHILKLPYDPNANIDTDFAFVNPGSDIGGSLQYLEVLLTTFLSSHGIDPKSISMNGEGQNYTSGVERLLAMIEKVSASREDYDTFSRTEEKVWHLIRSWLNALSNSETLSPKYRTSFISDESQIKIDFASPEMVKSDMEELDVISREIELGISSPIQAIMQRESLSQEQAEEKYLQYQRETIGEVVIAPQDNRE